MEVGNGDCVMGNVPQLMKEQSSFEKIPGISHTDSTLRYFTFSYNINNCSQRGFKKHLCVFHMVGFNPMQASKASTQFMIHFE